jgi:hypothetical protein
MLLVGVLAMGCARDNSPQVLFQDGKASGFTFNSLKKRLEKQGGKVTIQTHQGEVMLSTSTLKIELRKEPDAYYVKNAYLPGQKPSGLAFTPGGAMLEQEDVEAQGNVKRIFAGLSLGD